MLDTLLAKLKAEGHRVLIYSQMTRMIDLLEVKLRKMSWLIIVCNTDAQTKFIRALVILNEAR